jgi:hypothetical protein
MNDQLTTIVIDTMPEVIRIAEQAERVHGPVALELRGRRIAIVHPSNDEPRIVRSPVRKEVRSRRGKIMRWYGAPIPSDGVDLSEAELRDEFERGVAEALLRELT